MQQCITKNDRRRRRQFSINFPNWDDLKEEEEEDAEEEEEEVLTKEKTN